MKARLVAGPFAALGLLLAASASNAQVRVGIDPGHPDPSYGKSVALTVGTPLSPTYFGTIPNQTPLRGILIVCTVAGNVSLTLADSSTIVVPVSVGVTILPFQVIEVNTSGTTATATYADLG